MQLEEHEIIDLVCVTCARPDVFIDSDVLARTLCMSRRVRA